MDMYPKHFWDVFDLSLDRASQDSVWKDSVAEIERIVDNSNINNSTEEDLFSSYNAQWTHVMYKMYDFLTRTDQ